MTEVRYSFVAPAAAAAVLAFSAPAAATTQQVRFEVPRVRATAEYGPIDLRDLFIIGTGFVSGNYEPIEGVDFGELTDADVAMMQHALTAGAEEMDFSEFYLDDDED